VLLILLMVFLTLLSAPDCRRLHEAFLTGVIVLGLKTLRFFDHNGFQNVNNRSTPLISLKKKLTCRKLVNDLLTFGTS